MADEQTVSHDEPLYIQLAPFPIAIHLCVPAAPAARPIDGGGPCWPIVTIKLTDNFMNGNHKQALSGVTLAAIGVVYGDIGTSAVGCNKRNALHRLKIF